MLSLSIDSLITIHGLSCAFLCGLIWTIQLVHYPFFRFVDDHQWREAHRFHTDRISWIVVPTMTIELLSAGMLFYLASSWLWGMNLALVLATWLSTVVLSVPLHNGLSEVRDSALIARLVATNWPRTILWSLRSILFAVAAGVA